MIDIDKQVVIEKYFELRDKSQIKIIKADIVCKNLYLLVKN